MSTKKRGDAAKIKRLADEYEGVRDQDGWETLALTLRADHPALATQILDELRRRATC